MGLVWSVAVPSKENDRARANGRGKCIIGGGGGGPKPFFGEGFYGMFEQFPLSGTPVRVF